MSLLATSASASTALKQPALMIGHADTVVNHINRSQARSIFSMRARQWADGSDITVFVMDDDSSLHHNFCQSLLGMLPHQLRRTWDRATYTGRGSPPITVTDDDEMMRQVAQTPGAIGYISGDIDIRTQANVRIIHAL